MPFSKISFQWMIASGSWLPTSFKTSKIKKLLYRSYQAFLFICFTINSIAEPMFVVKHIISKADIIEYNKVMYLAPLGFLIYLKMLFLSFNRKKISALMKILNSDECKSRNPSEREIENEWDKIIR